MALILVDFRWHTFGWPILRDMAKVCRQMGHRVIRWHSLGNLDTSLWLMAAGKPDVAIIYNGLNSEHRCWSDRLARTAATKVYVESGWYPQQGHWQVDTSGINANASWVSLPLTSVPASPLPIRPQGDLLVVLQYDCDTQLSPLMSPWYPDMFSLVKVLAEHSRIPLRLRKHPRHEPDPRIVALAREKQIPWCSAPTFGAALERCRAVATVNSSAGVEALACRVPVLCYGRAVYRYPGAVYCLGPNGADTEAATAALREGRSSLWTELVDETTRRITANQWRLADVPVKLPELVDSLLAKRRQGARFLLPRARGLRKVIRHFRKRRAA